MQVTKNEVKVITNTYTFELSEKEFMLLFEGLGNTSHNTRVASGMTVEQSKSIYSFYDAMVKAHNGY